MRETNISERVEPGFEVIRPSPVKGIFEINFKYPKGYLVYLFNIILAAKKEQQLKILMITKEGQIKKVQKDTSKEEQKPIIVKIAPIKKNHYIGVFEIDFTCSSTELLNEFREKLNKYGVKGLSRYNALNKQFDLSRKVYDLRKKDQKYIPIAIQAWENEEIDNLQGKYKTEWDKNLFYKYAKLHYRRKYTQKVYKIIKRFEKYIEKEFNFL